MYSTFIYFALRVGVSSKFHFILYDMAVLKIGDGNFSPDDVIVNENLEVDIWKPLLSYSTASTTQNDYARCADVLEVCEVDGRLPGVFNHPRGSLRNFIPPEHFSNTMVCKFQRYVTTHMALRPPIANLNFC